MRLPTPARLGDDRPPRRAARACGWPRPSRPCAMRTARSRSCSGWSGSAAAWRGDGTSRRSATASSPTRRTATSMGSSPSSRRRSASPSAGRPTRRSCSSRRCSTPRSPRTRCRRSRPTPPCSSPHRPASQGWSSTPSWSPRCRTASGRTCACAARSCTRRSSCAPCSGVEEESLDLRKLVRDDELRMFALAVSRAKRRLVLAAVANDDEAPSPFFAILPPLPELPAAELEAMTLRAVTGRLRRLVVNGSPQEQRGCRAARSPRSPPTTSRERIPAPGRDCWRHPPTARCTTARTRCRSRPLARDGLEVAARLVRRDG